MPDMFQVLADPTRRRLVAALRAGERPVNDLVREVPIGQPGVSRQLAILQGTGFVKVRPDGRRRLYSLNSAPFRELDEWMQVYRELWDGRLDRLGEELQQRQ